MSVFVLLFFGFSDEATLENVLAVPNGQKYSLCMLVLNSTAAAFENSVIVYLEVIFG